MRMYESTWKPFGAFNAKTKLQDLQKFLFLRRPADGRPSWKHKSNFRERGTSYDVMLNMFMDVKCQELSNVGVHSFISSDYEGVESFLCDFLLVRRPADAEETQKALHTFVAW